MNKQDIITFFDHYASSWDDNMIRNESVINTILDPLFIFVFKWGIAGAAWATIIGQFF